MYNTPGFPIALKPQIRRRPPSDRRYGQCLTISSEISTQILMTPQAMRSGGGRYFRMAGTRLSEVD